MNLEEWEALRHGTLIGATCTRTPSLKRHAKWQPFSTEVRRAIKHDDEEITEVKGCETAKPICDAAVIEVENTADANEEDRSLKVYEVEYRAVITLAAQDMQKAALHGAAVIKDNPHLIYVRAVHERNCEQACVPLQTEWEKGELRVSSRLEVQASMNDNNRRYCSPEQKVAIHCEHLIEGKAVSDLCDKHHM
jgi:hypothetical protein